MSGKVTEKNGLECPESIAHLWDQPHPGKPIRPSTPRLFTAIAGEALACLHKADWENRIRRIENILSVIKWRIRSHREEWQEGEIEKLVKGNRPEDGLKGKGVSK